MATRQTAPSPSEPQKQSPVGCILRLFWMFGGNLALVVLAGLIFQSAGWTIADLAYWLIVGLLVSARYIDIARFNGATADLEPATTAHLKRYSLLLVLGAAAVYVTARALGPGF